MNKKNKILNLKSYILNLHGGFGLLEALTYVAILSLLLIVVVQSALLIQSLTDRSRLTRTIAHEAGEAVERMVREVRLAEGAAMEGSVFNIHPGILKLNTVESSSESAPAVREFFLSGETLMMKEGESAPVALTANIRVKRLVFYHVVAGDVSEAVTLELVAEGVSGNVTESRTFNATAVLRGSY